VEPAGTVVRRRGVIAILWLAVLAALVPGVPALRQRMVAGTSVAGSESERVTEALGRDFGSPFARTAVGVVRGAGAGSLEAGAPLAWRLRAAAAAVPGVRRVAWLSPPSVATRGVNALVVAGLALDAEPDSVIAGLRAATDAALAGPSAGAAARPEGLDASAPTVAWTGNEALNADLRRFSIADSRRAERWAVVPTVILLLLAFGALVAAAVPVALGVLATTLALGLAALIGYLLPEWRPSVTLQSVTSVLGLALGVDYALLVVTRFREALAAGATAEAAAARAAARGGAAVILSGAAAATGFAALLAVPVNELRSAAVGGLTVVTSAVLLATTALPGVLAWLGPRLETGRVPFWRPPAGRLDSWRRWGERVVRRPWTVLVIASLPLAALASQAPRLRIALPRSEWLPAELESVAGLQALERAGLTSRVYALQLLVHLPNGLSATSPTGWDAVHRAANAIAADSAVAGVRALPTLVSGLLPAGVAAALIPDSVRRTLVSADGHTALIEAWPREGLPRDGLTALVRRLRATGGPALTGLDGATLAIGGFPAAHTDYEDAIGGRFGLVMLLAVVGAAAALAVGFRSVLVPVKAVALNLLSVFAALGALVLVFQDGDLAALGFGPARGGVFPVVPILAFCALFGISLDYEVFLVTRTREAWRGGAGASEAIVESLARTGGLITSAAAIMVGVFTAFALGDLLPNRMLGFALATAVALDATIVRAALGPALLRLAGRRNWWPGGRRGPA
jgi:RND superfamily putative drug exporter